MDGLVLIVAGWGRVCFTLGCRLTCGRGTGWGREADVLGAAYSLVWGEGMCYNIPILERQRMTIMSYEPFYERFPKVAEKETRTIVSMNDSDLPDDEYGLTEAYCNEPNCDCRRVFFNVYSWQKRKVVAVIAYGWESREYYARWFGDDDPQMLRELQGPVLNTWSPQSKLAPVLLERVKWILQDRRYIARIKRHYKMFRSTVDNAVREPKSSSATKVGRNDPCPCGSGKKYKRCCRQFT